MNSIRIKQYLQITAFSVLVFLISIGIKKIKPEWVYEHYVWLISYFFIITIASLFIVDMAIKKNPENISRNYFVAMLIRLFASVLVALLFIYFDRENASVFAGNFIVLYFMYLGFEIYALMSNLQSHYKEGKSPDEKEECS